MYFVWLSSKGDRLVCGSSTNLQIWDLSRDALISTLAHGGDVASACFSPDATFIASAGGSTVKLWTTEFHESPDSHSDEVTCICFSEDGRLTDDGTVKIWDAVDCSRLVTLSCSTDESDISFTSVAFSPNRALVGAGCYDGAVRIWDVASQKSRSQWMDRHEFSVTDMRFSPDGSKLVSVSDESIRVWDTETGSFLAFNDMYRSIEWVTFSDGGKIVVQADGKLQNLELCAVSTSSPTIGPSEEMAAASTPFELVLSTDDEPTIQQPPPSYRLLEQLGWEWDHQWIVDSQGRRVFHWLDARVSACHMRKVAVGTSTGRVAILDFSNITD